MAPIYSVTPTSSASRRAWCRCVLHRRATIEAFLIDPLLYGDMGDGFLLQVAFLGGGAVVVLECAFYIDRVSVVPLDQVARRTYEPSQGDQNTPG